MPIVRPLGDGDRSSSYLYRISDLTLTLLMLRPSFPSISSCSSHPVSGIHVGGWLALLTKCCELKRIHLNLSNLFWRLPANSHEEMNMSFSPTPVRGIIVVIFLWKDYSIRTRAFRIRRKVICSFPFDQLWFQLISLVAVPFNLIFEEWICYPASSFDCTGSNTEHGVPLKSFTVEIASLMVIRTPLCVASSQRISTAWVWEWLV